MPAPIDKCMAPLYQPKLWKEIKKSEILENSNCFSYAFNYVDIGDSKIQPGELRGDKYDETTCGNIIGKIEKDYPDLRKIKKEYILSNVIDEIKKKNKDIDSGTILDIIKTNKKYNHFKNISIKDIKNVNKKNTFPRFSHNIEKCNMNEQRYKIALVIDKDSKTNKDDRNTDYHFYKESSNPENGHLFWSHKPGTNKVTKHDASNEIIKNPELCDRNYKAKCKNENNENEEDCSDDHNYDTFCGYFTYPYKDGPILRLVTEDQRNENNNENN
jgi:hypothetical protein